MSLKCKEIGSVVKLLGCMRMNFCTLQTETEGVSKLWCMLDEGPGNKEYYRNVNLDYDDYAFALVNVSIT